MGGGRDAGRLALAQSCLYEHSLLRVWDSGAALPLTSPGTASKILPASGPRILNWKLGAVIPDASPPGSVHTPKEAARARAGLTYPSVPRTSAPRRSPGPDTGIPPPFSFGRCPQAEWGEEGAHGLRMNHNELKKESRSDMSGSSRDFQ